MYRPSLLQLFCWTLLACLTAPNVHATESTSKPVLRVGVVYPVGDTGNRILSGVNRAVSEYSSGNARFQVDVAQFPYLDENAGIDTIIALFDDKSIHLVIGPSDSGVFVEIANRAEYKDRASLPIVSSLVTAQEGNAEGDWRFRTNVDVEARARAASDFLNHAGYQAIAVLYRNNEFGNRAAEAFKNQLVEAEGNYFALPYEDEIQLRDQVRKVLERRPGAVGVFGRRHDLKIVRREFEALNSGWFQYRPLLFSINDTRALKLPDTYFVSLVGPNRVSAADDPVEVWDEVRGLAFDTTLLVLGIAGQMQSVPGDETWADAFRKRLFSRMLGPPQADRRFKTGMEFSDGKNLASPVVLEQTESGEQFAVAGHPPGKLWKLGDWIEIRERRFGDAIWFNIIGVTLLALWLTMADIRRRQSIRARSLYFCRPVIALALFNVLSAVATLIVVAELNFIRWDNVFAALGVAIGHRALLTTTIFETAQGRALGFGRLYERTLASINERIMMSLYEKQCAAINYVTYTNSLPNLRDLLVNIYGYAHDGSDTRALVESLDADIARAQGALKKQEVCARRLLQVMSWKQLQANRIIPEYIKQNELIDPHTILRDSVQYILREAPDRKAAINDLIESALSELRENSDESPPRGEKELTEALAKAQTERGRLYCRLRWLYTQWGFSLRRILKERLLPEDYKMRNRRMVSMLGAWHDRKRQQDAEGSEIAAQAAAASAEHERRKDQRKSVDFAARLTILDTNHVPVCELDVSVTDFGLGGARLLVGANAMEAVPGEIDTLYLVITTGPLSGIFCEARLVYRHGGDSGIQLGIAWISPSSEMREKVGRLATPGQGYVSCDAA